MERGRERGEVERGKSELQNILKSLHDSAGVLIRGVLPSIPHLTYVTTLRTPVRLLPVGMARATQ